MFNAAGYLEPGNEVNLSYLGFTRLHRPLPVGPRLEHDTLSRADSGALPDTSAIRPGLIYCVVETFEEQQGRITCPD
jgi:hypothetical protein